MQYFVTILLFFLVIHSSTHAGIIKTKKDLKELNIDNPLMEAFYSNDLQTAKQILKDFNNKWNMKEIILVATLEQGGPFMDEKVRLLIEYGANPIKKTTAQDTALNTAVAYKRWNSLQTILACAHVQARLQPE